MRRFRSFFILTCLGTLLLASCSHRPLVEATDVHYARIYIDSIIRNINLELYNPAHRIPTLNMPVVMRALLCDSETGEVKAERYLQHVGRDTLGYYIDGHLIAPPGHYKFMAYSFGTETTMMQGEYNYFDATAYTNPISPQYISKLPGLSHRAGTNDLESLRYEPDHLFSTIIEEVELVGSGELDTIRTRQGEYPCASTVVLSYYIQLQVRGAQYIASTSALLSGMAPQKTLHNHNTSHLSPVKIYFEMQPTENQPDGTAHLYATFNVFGKVPDADSDLNIHLDLITLDGRNQSHTFNVTPEFHTEEGQEQQWLLLDYEITVDPPPVVGGQGSDFKPTVADWEDENADITI